MEPRLDLGKEEMPFEYLIFQLMDLSVDSLGRTNLQTRAVSIQCQFVCGPLCDQMFALLNS